MSPPSGPFRLVTVNTAPDRARLIVGRVTEALKDEFIIEHVGNCESMSTHLPLPLDSPTSKSSSVGVLANMIWYM